MSFKIFSHKLTARTQKKHCTRFCSKLFKIVQSIHHIRYFARKKKTCQTRFRVLKSKGVGAPPTSPMPGVSLPMSYVQTQKFWRCPNFPYLKHFPYLTRWAPPEISRFHPLSPPQIDLEKLHLIGWKPIWSLTLARKWCFATFAGVGGGATPPLGVSKRSVVELRGKDEQIALAIGGIIFSPRSIFDPVMAGQRSNFRIFRDFLVSRVHISKSIDRRGMKPSPACSPFNYA